MLYFQAFLGIGLFKFSHVDVNKKGYADKSGNKAGTPITHKGKRNSHNRKQTCCHKNIDNEMKEEKNTDTKAEKCSIKIFAKIGDTYTPVHDKKVHK